LTVLKKYCAATIENKVVKISQLLTIKFMKNNNNRTLEGNTEFVDEHEKRELRRPEVTSEQSKINLNIGLNKVKVLIAGLTGDFIGAFYNNEFLGHGAIRTLASDGEMPILELALEKNKWAALYDDDMVFSGDRNNVKTDIKNHIGDKEISSMQFSPKSDTEPFYYIVGLPVTKKDYESFNAKVKKLLAQNYQKRIVQEPYTRELPSEIEKKVEDFQLDFETKYILQNGQIVQSGKVNLQRIYCGSWEGSKGPSTYGFVNAYDLAEWRKGNRVEKRIDKEIGYQGSLFGINKITIEPNTVVLCTGGECIDIDGKKWKEIYICE